VEPTTIENTLNSNKYIEQIYIHGEISKSILVAIIVPNYNLLTQFAVKHNIPYELLCLVDCFKNNRLIKIKIIPDYC
jgi:long-subunit acyl-CoA synthetase (AMP-forming)